jgi:hypothetical protein
MLSYYYPLLHQIMLAPFAGIMDINIECMLFCGVIKLLNKLLLGQFAQTVGLPYFVMRRIFSDVGMCITWFTSFKDSILNTFLAQVVSTITVLCH